MWGALRLRTTAAHTQNDRQGPRRRKSAACAQTTASPRAHPAVDFKVSRLRWRAPRGLSRPRTLTTEHNAKCWINASWRNATHFCTADAALPRSHDPCARAAYDRAGRKPATERRGALFFPLAFRTSQAGGVRRGLSANKKSLTSHLC